MKTKNAKEAGLAYSELAKKLNSIYEAAQDGDNIDLSKVPSNLLDGDDARRREVMLQYNTELADLGNELMEHKKLENGQKAARDGQRAATQPGAGFPQARGSSGSSSSLGQSFLDSEEWQSYVNQFNGHIPDRARVQSPPVPIKGSLLRGGPQNALVTSTPGGNTGAPLVIPDFTSIISPFPFRELTVMDVITHGTTNSDTVEFVRVTGFTNAAAGVAESATTADPATMNAAGGVKPESALTLQRVSATVQAIAHWIPATKRALADAGQIRTLIDGFLQMGLRLQVEDQVISGSGTGEEIEGFDTALTLTQAYSATVTGLNPQLETARKALTAIQLAKGIKPNAYIFHPSDWETIDLARLEKNPYNDASQLGVPTLFGFPVVINQGIPVGWGFLGDFKQYVLWDREQSSISVSDSHADFFIRNMVAILAELRAAGALIRTDAICRFDLTAL